MAYTVYCHSNKINGKKYIGITSQKVLARWQSGKHYSRHASFYADILKYGWDNFSHEILYTGLTKESAEQIEKELIFTLGLRDPEKGYNKFKGGSLPKGITEKGKESLSRQNKGKNNPFFGCTHSEEAKKLMSSNRPKRAVICIEKNIKYKSTREAERQTKICHSDISKSCKDPSKSAGGYHWKYEEVS